MEQSSQLATRITKRQLATARTCVAAAAMTGNRATAAAAIELKL